MELKSIKLAGFKSFVDPTTVPIRSHLNAIIGPNGCGKSNVVDAIRWVIGETSAKQLRGQSMADVIFNGTTSRKPVGKASVELHFDNSDGRIGGEYAKFTDISVRREIERDGQSSYFLNNTACRRRDIIDIFLGTGLGPRSYSIIEQGMVSRLVEAKPEDFRVHIEEAAGISKYKERRRETENRIKRTQENLDRLNDLIDEVGKQSRHLKRQANSAERYKVLKEEERQLQAQIKALHWQTLNTQATAQEEQIKQQQITIDEQISQQRHIEADIEKTRIAHTEANESHNEVQRQYYSLGAEIARIEQQIQNTQQQTERWQQELEESQQHATELTENMAEQQDQIAELKVEIEGLSPQSNERQNALQEKQQTFTHAQQTMQRWQQTWEQFQSKSAQTNQRISVTTNNIEHYQKQMTQLEQRLTTLSQQQEQQGLETLHAEIAPIEQTVGQRQQQLADLKAQMQMQSEKIQTRRQNNTQQQQQLDTVRRDLQAKEAQMASLEALQQAAMSDHGEQVNHWLQQQHLAESPRLGKSLRVKSGWEVAVETVLSGYFDAVCVNNTQDYLEQLAQLNEGALTLVDTQVRMEPTGHKATTLESLVESDWPLSPWLAGIYAVTDLPEAMRLRSQLSANESVITQDGVWVGPNWVRLTKTQTREDSVIVREQKIEELKVDIEQLQQRVAEQQARVQAGEQELKSLEEQRDQQQEQYQELSASYAEMQAELRAKQTRVAEMKQQQQRLRDEISHQQQQLTQLKDSLTQAQQTLQESNDVQSQLNEQKAQLLAERDRYQQALEAARDQLNQQRQLADEVSIRLSSSESQLTLLQQTVDREERQLTKVSQRIETLQGQLSETTGPLDTFQKQLQERLQARVEIEKSLNAAQELLTTHQNALDDLQTKLAQQGKAINAAKEAMQQLQMDRQALTVRQSTIQEQLAESEIDLDKVLAEMPEEADLAAWEENAERIALKISRLGPINLAAIDEHRTLEERKVYLDKQHADLNEALDILKAAIRKIDRETKAKFHDTFTKVNTKFQELFPKIFGGGSASLELLDDDILTTGIMVKAQPPGKRNSTIHMLSGGEKALTAIALVFSFFTLNPAPFCILDEVDAPLDDLNVGRFVQLVKSMSDNTQFLVISHNKVTIEMADHLMGVTMQEAGVSRLVSVDIQEAMEMVEA